MAIISCCQVLMKVSMIHMFQGKNTSLTIGSVQPFAYQKLMITLARTREGLKSKYVLYRPTVFL